jgi:hypothetical protein
MAALSKEKKKNIGVEKRQHSKYYYDYTRNMSFEQAERFNKKQKKQNRRK